MALGGRLVQPALPGLLTPLASPAPFSQSDTHTKLTIGGENPVKARQICARLRHQGSQLRNEVQRLEYHVRGASATRSRFEKLFPSFDWKPSVLPDESRGMNKELP